jgi:hypothetical protein
VGSGFRFGPHPSGALLLLALLLLALLLLAPLLLGFG